MLNKVIKYGKVVLCALTAGLGAISLFTGALAGAACLGDGEVKIGTKEIAGESDDSEA